MKIANALKHAAKLMASGFIAAIGFILLAKGSFFEIEESIKNTFFSLLAVQLMAVTAGVLGADRKILSLLSSASEATSIHLSKELYAWIAAIASVTLIILSTYYNATTEVSLTICASIVFDALASIKQAELSAKLKTNKILMANAIRYPLFFALLLVAGEVSEITTAVIFGIFFITSALRFCITNWPSSVCIKEIDIKPDIYLGSFQVSNYLINRGAQTLVGTSLLSIGEESQSILFLSWKIIELIDKIVITLIPLLLTITLQSKKSTALLVATLASLSSLTAFMAIMTITSDLLNYLSPTYIAWLLIHAALIYPSNILFLITLRDSGGATALRASVIAIALSVLVLLVFSLINKSMLGLVLFTPTGLLVMTLIMTFSHVSKKPKLTRI